MVGEVDGFPSIVQALIYIGSGVAVTIAALIGGRHKKSDETMSERDRIAALERVQRERVQREQTDLELEAMRKELKRDLGEVMKAVREALEAQIREINRQIVSLRQQVARLSRKQAK